MGFWCAKPATMAKHRARILCDHKPLLKLANRLDKQEEFKLEGPDYSKLSSPAPHANLKSWYGKKSIVLIHEEELTEELYSHDLVDRLVEGFTFLMPYYDYFSTLWADPDPRQN